MRPPAICWVEGIRQPRERRTMTINIELGPDEEEALSQRARGSGRDLTEYVHQILQEHLRSAAGRTRTTPPDPG